MASLPELKKNGSTSLLTHPYFAGTVIFLSAFLARVIFYLVFERLHPGMMTQSLGINGWLDIARNVTAGQGYSEHSLLTYFPVDRLIPTAARSPLPVLILSLLLLVFHQQTLVLLIYSWMLSSLTAVLLYFLAQKVLKSQKMGLATALLYCFYLPEMVISTAYASASESLFTLLLMGYFLTSLGDSETHSRKLAVGAGILLALACLSRPMVLFLPILYAGWMIWKHQAKAVTSLACFFAAFLICLSPWAIRNQIVFGKPIITSTLGGYNLLRHNFGLENRDYRLKTSEDFDPYAHRVIAAAGYDLKTINEVQADDVFTREALKIICKYPVRYLKFSVIRGFWLWYKIGAEQQPYLTQNAAIYLFMFPGMVLALLRRHVLSIFVLHIGYFVFFCALINAQFRFICPMMPYGIMLAVYAITLLEQKRQSLSSHRTG